MPRYVFLLRLSPDIRLTKPKVRRLNNLWQPQICPDRRVLNEELFNKTGVVQYRRETQTTGCRDVMNLRVKSYNSGVLVLRTRYDPSFFSQRLTPRRYIDPADLAFVPKGTQKIKTLCPYGHYTSLRRPVYLEDDIATRSTTFPYPWLTLTQYPTRTPGVYESYPWYSPTQYDQLYYPCGNGKCLSGPQECAIDLLVNPTANGNGICLPGGFVRCKPGFTTFFFTTEFTLFTGPVNVDPLTGLSTVGTWNNPVRSPSLAL